MTQSHATTVKKYVVQVSNGPRGGEPYSWMLTWTTTTDDLDRAFTFRHKKAAQKKADRWFDIHRRKAWVCEISETRIVQVGKT